jgi:hypothetical protein
LGEQQYFMVVFHRPNLWEQILQPSVETDSLVGTAIEMCRLAETWQSKSAIVLIWLGRIIKVHQDINEHL